MYLGEADGNSATIPRERLARWARSGPAVLLLLRGVGEVYLSGPGDLDRSILVVLRAGGS
jgi:hypothetical protein